MDYLHPSNSSWVFLVFFLLFLKLLYFALYMSNGKNIYFLNRRSAFGWSPSIFWIHSLATLSVLTLQMSAAVVLSTCSLCLLLAIPEAWNSCGFYCCVVPLCFVVFWQFNSNNFYGWHQTIRLTYKRNGRNVCCYQYQYSEVVWLLRARKSISENIFWCLFNFWRFILYMTSYNKFDTCLSLIHI